ncbi:hypothetical protein BIV57_21835 [Mangrovactinospora gilvigrisea]|uniref:ESAT-6-like protein n=2 Tax=Mangrovactinospora gilvigrisea TaxID=1428644 RepID=A0A1J7B9V3_9ACTN|nr:hypothetical protein BIV57_21835 [Mangrovactinospora gilvigrisea]
MHRVAERTTAVNAEIHAELRRLQSVVGTVAHGWRGDGATAYAQLQHRWNEDAEMLGRALDAIAERLHAAARNYTAADEEQRVRLSGIRAALG